MIFLAVAKEKGIGRQALSERTGLGQGSVRTILKKLRKGGYLDSGIQGSHLTGSGQKLYNAITKKLVGPATLNGTSLTVGPAQSAILIRSLGSLIGSGIEQRDSAVGVGANGATTYIIKNGKFTIPRGSNDCERDYPSPAWSTLSNELGPKNGDVVIVCGAAEETTAKIGALSAVLTIL
jgi:hypothetical protein